MIKPATTLNWIPESVKVRVYDEWKPLKKVTIKDSFVTYSEGHFKSLPLKGMATRVKDFTSVVMLQQELTGSRIKLCKKTSLLDANNDALNLDDIGFGEFIDLRVNFEAGECKVSNAKEEALVSVYFEEPVYILAAIGGNYIFILV